MKIHRIAALLPFALLVGCATTMDTTAPMMGGVPDADIAGIVQTVNAGEAQQGEAARPRANAAEVRAFAQMMITEHSAANQRAAEVFSRNNITPGENDTTRALRDAARRTIDALGTYRGAAFDRAYMRSQVEQHEYVLNLLDQHLIPSARNAELRTLLQTQRGSVSAHLDRARQILNGL